MKRKLKSIFAMMCIALMASVSFTSCSDDLNEMEIKDEKSSDGSNKEAGYFT